MTTDKGHDARFGGIQRLYGDLPSRRIAAAHVLIVGLGGVGSWVAEALARSGVGALTLIDGDDVCVSNVNRQLHALDGTIGRRKVEVMAERVKAINPACRVTVFDEFFRMDSVEKHFPVQYDYVVDAIDGVSMKATLIGSAHARKIPVITCGGAGGKLDPLRVQLVDLAETSNDRLLFFVRRKLRKHYGFPRTGEKFGVPCIYSTEEVRLPDGDACAAEPREEDDALFSDADARLACDGRLGSATHITGIFGFAVAAHVVNEIAAKEIEPRIDANERE